MLVEDGSGVNDQGSSPELRGDGLQRPLLIGVYREAPERRTQAGRPNPYGNPATPLRALGLDKEVKPERGQLARGPATEPPHGPLVPGKHNAGRVSPVAVHAEDPGIIQEESVIDSDVSLKDLAGRPHIRVTLRKLVVEGCLVFALLELRSLHLRSGERYE